MSRLRRHRTIGLAKSARPKILRAAMKGQNTATRILGIECGATRSTFAMVEDEPAVYWQGRFGPANLRLLDDDQLVRHFRAIGKALPKPAALGIGMAGARNEAD